MIDLRLGDYREVLADVECDVLICDPPYGARTHKRHDAGTTRVLSTPIGTPRWDTARRNSLSYGSWTPDDVNAFVDSWHPRVRGWICAMSCSDLFPVWRAAFERVGRVAFAPVPCIIRAMSVRLSGDGPSNWTVYLNVARPKGLIDGTRRGAYEADVRDPDHYIVNRSPGHIGGKPDALMLQIVDHYSNPGDLVCDPCAGGGTTLRAAEKLGRRAIGAEVDRATFDKATGFAPPPEVEGQGRLF